MEHLLNFIAGVFGGWVIFDASTRTTTTTTTTTSTNNGWLASSSSGVKLVMCNICTFAPRLPPCLREPKKKKTKTALKGTDAKYGSSVNYGSLMHFICYALHRYCTAQFQLYFFFFYVSVYCLLHFSIFHVSFSCVLSFISYHQYLHRFIVK